MYSDDFNKAFNYVMLAEVGPWFNPNDPLVQLGLINNKQNQSACGYVNDPKDPGGETKFGIAQKANPSVCVATLTLDDAKKIYMNQYWLAAKCDRIASPLNVLHFDTAVNMGVGTAAKLLQAALGVVVDGAIGPQTLDALSKITNPSQLCTTYLNLRQARYDAIVKATPTSAKFAAGWRSRNDALRKYLGVN